MKPLTLLVIADPHYINHSASMIDAPAHQGRYMIEWIKRAMQEATSFKAPDALVLLGDIIENGSDAQAKTDMKEFAEATQQLDIPCVAIPGNHDGSPERFLQVFGERVGAHDINGYNLYTFLDDRSPEDLTTRPAGAVTAFKQNCDERPVIAIQHNPVYPHVDCSKWPFMLTNASEVVASYDHANVVLSLSGHFHKGMEPVVRNGTTYLTCPSIAKGSFPFYLVTIYGHEVEAKKLHLAMPQNHALFDTHTHTHFGYCAINVHPELSLKRAKLLGLRGIACTEHAGQIYLTNEQYWKQQHVQNPDVIRKARDAKTDRMAEYRADMERYRSPFLLVGLEVECDKNGNLNLLKEDREGWDILLGAIHYIPEQFSTNTPSQCKEGFMWTVEKLVSQGINVLAHPFRVLSQMGLTQWSELHLPVAKLLKANGVAAEINLRHNQNDTDFLQICVEQGVHLTLASDAHNLHEVGWLQPHLRILENIGSPLTVWHEEGYNICFR